MFYTETSKLYRLDLMKENIIYFIACVLVVLLANTISYYIDGERLSFFEAFVVSCLTLIGGKE